MPSALRQTYLDYSKETSKNHTNITTITAGNLVTVNTAIDALVLAENSLTLLSRQNREVLASETITNAPRPTDPNAQRERKWKVHYTDTSGFKGTYTIPGAVVIDSGTPLVKQDTDLADLTTTLWSNWITAFLAVAQSVRGNGVSSVDFAQLIGVAI